MTRFPLTPTDRRDLLNHYRRSSDPAVGHLWATIGAVLFCSTSTISRWQRRFEKGGTDADFGRPRGRRKAVTRNHRCHTMAELLDLTFEWFEVRIHFRVRSSVYAETPGK